jgi:hypothetical protein
VFFAAAIREGDQGMDKDSPFRRFHQGTLDLAVVKPEYQNFDTFPGFPDPLDEAVNPVTGLE